MGGMVDNVLIKGVTVFLESLIERICMCYMYIIYTLPLMMMFIYVHHLVPIFLNNDLVEFIQPPYCVYM